MESPVVLDKPPEYHGNNDRGFPFEEEEGSGAWSELAARHPDIAARLRQRPATWARKRRPSSQDATDDFGDSFSGFDRFPFDDIPPEFREHFPSQWNRRYSDRDQPAPETPAQHPPPAPPPQHHTAATQTEHEPQSESEQTLPQYGLRNTVDLGQKSPADPSVDADDRSQRSMSAPPDAPRTVNPDMSANHQEAAHPPHEHHSNVRHIPIFVEGRDEPVINKNVDHGAHYTESKPHPPPPPQPQPHLDRDQYFADDGPVGFHHPPNFTRAFGTPFNKGFRQGPQPFTQQKAYPQNAFTRGPSPQRAQSPHHQEESYVKVPVHHEHATSNTETPSRAQQKQAPQPKQPSPQRQQPSPQPREQTPPPKAQPTSNDPITQILSIQTDVLNLMTEVENFKGTKKDKRYLFLDEMLTRNLIKLDNIETEGKENIRQARKEAIRCIQKCIAVLEAKADSNTTKAAQAQAQGIDVNESSDSAMEPALVMENGEIEMKEPPKDDQKNDTQPERIDNIQPPNEEIKEDVKREQTPKLQEKQTQPEPAAISAENQAQAPAADTRPEDPQPEDKSEEQKQVENKPCPKKKVVKKRDKSKEAPKDRTEEASQDSNKPEVAQNDEKVEVMQVDDKGDRPMEVDGAASQ